MKFFTALISIILMLSVSSVSFGQMTTSDLTSHLQDISVTIKSGSAYSKAEGSGVIVTRKVCTDVKKKKVETVNFVWTAGHVIDNLRSVRTVIDPKTGTERKKIEFKDAQIVKELVESGRRVGELKMDCKVIKYSDAEDGEDLALLMVRKRDFISSGASAKFYLEKDDVDNVGVIPIGTRLYHVGSLLGQMGANSMTSGIMSQVGRVLDLGSSDGVVFDQTTVAAFPGSSGGGVFLTETSDKQAGCYVGMLVRGAGESFNLIVPVRRMYAWAQKGKVAWAMDNSKVPNLEDILKLPLEVANITSNSERTTPAGGKDLSEDSIKFPTLLHLQRKGKMYHGFHLVGPRIKLGEPAPMPEPKINFDE
jgi:hypothetical protein